jgi:hypothetical protein
MKTKSKKAPKKQVISNLKTVLRSVLYVTGNTLNGISHLQFKHDNGTLDAEYIAKLKRDAENAVKELNKLDELKNVEFVDSDDGEQVVIKIDNYIFSDGSFSRVKKKDMKK